MRIVLAPAASMRADAAWMTTWARHLAPLGSVATFDWPRGFAIPPLVAALSSAVPVGEGPLLLVGKSMGARIACIAAGELGARAVVAFGFPLVPASGRVAEREAVLRATAVPVLFIAGDRDPMCPLPHLERIRGEMSVPTRVHVVPGADHSLRPRVAPDAACLEAIRAFLP
jgi:uncharacterized protein